MPERYLRALSRALWDTDLVGVRVTLFIAELFWAVMLFWPGDTFGRPTYHLMEMTMPELAWACVFLLSAVTQLTIVLQEDFHSKFARYFAGWNACLWAYCVGSMLLSVYPPPAAIGGEIALMVSAIWVWARPFVLAFGVQRAHARTV